MTILPARRVHLQTTLCPIEFGRPNREGRTLPHPGRPAIEVAAVLRALAPTADEARWLVTHVEDDVARAIVAASVAANPLALGETIATLGAADVVDTVVAKLATYRAGLLRRERAALSAAVEAMEEASANTEAEALAASAGGPRDEGAPGATTPIDPRSTFHALFSRVASFETQPFALRVRGLLSSPSIASEQKKALLDKLEKLGLEAASPTLQADWENLGLVFGGGAYVRPRLQYSFRVARPFQGRPSRRRDTKSTGRYRRSQRNGPVGYRRETPDRDSIRCR